MKNDEIVIIDSGMGNLNSLSKCVEILGFKFKIVDDPDKKVNCNKIIFPGVGSYSEAMNKIKIKKWDKFLRRKTLEEGCFFLGICIGMQILSEFGYENKKTAGLNIIKGNVISLKKLNIENKIPHVGWNDITIKKNPLFEGIKNNSDFYFDHSYALHTDNKEVISSICNYGSKFVSSINKERVYGTQFHPEKSSDNGKRVLFNFLNQNY